MLQLLKVEWMKVRHYRTFWVLSILYLVSIYGVNYIAFLIQENIRPKKADLATNLIMGNPAFEFPEVWQTVSYLSSFLLFIPGLLMIISFTNEYSYKTHRQNIIDGWSRRQYILVKMSLTLVIAIVSSIAVFITAFLFGLFEGASDVSFEKVQFVGYFFIQSLSYSAVALLFGLLFKRSGIAIGVFFLYVFVLENVIAGLMNRYLNNSGRFLPIETTDNLIPFPFFKNVVNQFRATTDPMLLLVISAVYLALYFFFCARRFETDDL
jgi:ABC-2 type transport system permease protein